MEKKELYVARFFGTECDDENDVTLCEAPTLEGCKKLVSDLCAHFNIKPKDDRTMFHRRHAESGKIYWEFLASEEWSGYDYCGDMYGFTGIRIMKSERYVMNGHAYHNIDIIQYVVDSVGAGERK